MRSSATTDCPSTLLGFGFLLLVASCGAPEVPEAEIPIGVEQGNRPPGLEGVTAGGEPFSLEGEPGEPTVLVFYRSASCGLCRVQLQQLQEHLPAYERQGARIAAITLDTPDTSQALAAEMKLTYPLVAVDSTVFTEWGIMHPELGVPLPATYILNSTGTIHFRHVGRNASDRTSDASLVAILESMDGA